MPNYQYNDEKKLVTVEFTLDEFNSLILLTSDAVEAFVEKAPSGANAKEIIVNGKSVWDHIAGQLHTQKAMRDTILTHIGAK